MAIQKNITHQESRQVLVYHNVFRIEWALHEKSLSVIVGSWKNAADHTANPNEPINIEKFTFNGPNYPITDINAGAIAPIYAKLKELPNFAGGVDV